VNLDRTEYEAGTGTRSLVAVQVAVEVVGGAVISVRVAVTIGVEGRIGLEAFNLGICFFIDPRCWLCRHCEQLQHVNSLDHSLPREVTSSSASAAILRIVWNPKIRNHSHKSPKSLSIMYRDSFTVHQTLGICFSVVVAQHIWMMMIIMIMTF